MEWSRVKSILICVFVLVNLFLLRVYINTNDTSVFVSDETINNTVIALKTNNVEIEKSLIAKKTSQATVFNIINKHINCKDFALVLWENAKKHGFDYFNPKNITITDDKLTYSAPLGGDTIKDVKAKIKKTGALYGYKYHCEEKEDLLVYTAIFENMYMYDSMITAKISDGNVVITMSNWLADSSESFAYSSVITVPEALLSFASTMKFQEVFKITAMEKGYIAGERNNEIQTKTATPVWKITGENKVYYIDMRNGDLLDL